MVPSSVQSRKRAVRLFISPHDSADLQHELMKLRARGGGRERGEHNVGQGSSRKLDKSRLQSSARHNVPETQGCIA